MCVQKAPMADFALVGAHFPGTQVNSVAVSTVTPSTFFSVSENGECKLWDLRLKKKDLVTIVLPRDDDGDDGDVADCLLLNRTAWVARGTAVSRVDLRTMGVSGVFRHASEISSLSWHQLAAGGQQPPPADALPLECILGDVDGGLAPCSLTEMASNLPVVRGPGPSSSSAGVASSFTDATGNAAIAVPWTPGSTTPPAPIANVICGVGFVGPVPGASQAVLCSVLMDGHVVTYMPSPDGRRIVVGQVTNTMADSTAMQPHASSVKKSTFCNPAFPACASFARAGCVAVGRADGTYCILDFNGDSTNGGREDDANADGVRSDCPTLTIALEAPGHESNGLVSVQWHANGTDLLTVALSGEVTMWRVAPLLAMVPEGDQQEEETGLPALTYAASLRTEQRQKCVVNCAALTSDSLRLLVGDTDGCISIAEIGC